MSIYCDVGYVKAGEKLSDAVVREVKEECGVDAEFLSVISFRHTHPLLFDKYVQVQPVGI